MRGRGSGEKKGKEPEFQYLFSWVTHILESPAGPESLVHRRLWNEFTLSVDKRPRPSMLPLPEGSFSYSFTLAFILPSSTWLSAT